MNQFCNIQLFKKQLVDDRLNVFINTLINHKIKRNENCFFNFNLFIFEENIQAFNSFSSFVFIRRDLFAKTFEKTTRKVLRIK